MFMFVVLFSVVVIAFDNRYLIFEHEKVWEKVYTHTNHVHKCCYIAKGIEKLFLLLLINR